VKAGGRKNLAASVRQRLLDLAKRRGEDFGFVLLRYGLERLLYRLGRSRHADRFVLKGAMLFPLWSGSSHRATRDIDLLGYGSPDLSRLEEVFREIADMPGDDGIEYLAGTVRAVPIREDAIYDGIRVTLEAELAVARLPIQVDVGFGDAVTPAPREADYPTLLAMPAPHLRVYPREPVIAEKLHAMVDLGVANSRMKDFYDVWFLSKSFEFEGAMLLSAVRATFTRRGTDVPTTAPVALTATFAQDAGKRMQWTAFAKRGRLLTSPTALEEVVERIGAFLGPLLTSEAESFVAHKRWRPQQGAWMVPE
jgi:predicted nucleotidyltransferase component of viral defense system